MQPSALPTTTATPTIGVMPQPSRASRPRPLLSSAIALAMAVAPAAFAQSSQATADAGLSQAELPVTGVVLFTNGVGYFEHKGTVTGNQQLELIVPPDQMDDLLQSLVLQDFGGGSISPVRYDSRDTLGRVLDSFSIDLSGNPTMAGILAQARGERVTIDAGQTIEGVIVGVERTETSDGPRTFLTLSTATGLRRLALDEVLDLRFENARLRDELAAALEAIARYRANDATTVRLVFRGEGEREVSIGYVREMPVWKTSYRLVVNDDGSADIQGWAIFDNPTDMDLSDVTVAFVAGQPISFVTALFDPVYVYRQRLQTQVTTSVVPTADQGVVGAAGLARSLLPAPSAPMAAQESVAGALADLAVVTPRLGETGVDSMADGARTGATFAYRVRERVTVGRHESAMIPIVQQSVEAHRVSLYDRGVLSGFPLAGVRIVNDTGLHLASGTVTIYDDNGFAGNALIADLVPGDTRVLTYAVDLEVALDLQGDSAQEQVVSVVIRGGLLEANVRHRLTTTLRITPRTEDERFLIVDLPRVDGYDIVTPQVAPLLTPTSLRFGVALGGSAGDAGSAEGGAVPTHLSCDSGTEECTLVVQLERVTARRTSLINVASDTIAFYLQNVEISAADRATLNQVLELQSLVAQLGRDMQIAQSSIDAIHVDQNRIRSNMNSLDRNSTLYRRYVADLEAQEDDLDRLGNQIEELREARIEAQGRLDALIAGLSVGGN